MATLEELRARAGVQPQQGATLESLRARVSEQPQQGSVSPVMGALRTVDDFVRTVAEGVTLGYADEMAAALNTATGLGPSEDYDANLAAERARDEEIPTVLRIGGNLLGGAAVPGGVARSIPGAIARGTGFGAVAGFGTGEGGVEERLESAAQGAALGGAAGGVLQSVSRAVSPRVTDDVARLRAEGVRPTMGQSIGPRASAVEQRAQSLPIMGDAIRSARRRAIEQFNRAAINQAVRPAGIQLPRGAAVGSEAIKEMGDRLSAQYYEILRGINRVRPDQQFADDMMRIVDAARDLDEEGQRAIGRLISNLQRRVSGTNNAALSGDDLKTIISGVRRQARQLRSAPDPFLRETGVVVDDIQLAFNDLLKRNATPENSQRLSNLDRAWAAFRRVEDAAGRTGAEDGVFTPAQLRSAVRAQDRSVNKRRFARGDALLQKLADDGRRVLGGRVPDSGTPERMLQAGAIGAGAGVDLATTGMAVGGLTAGAAPFTRPGQATVDALMNMRQGQVFQGGSQVVRRLLPGAAVASPTLLDVLMQQPLLDALSGPPPLVVDVPQLPR